MTTYPGEDQPLPMRYGGEPIAPDEALGVARRLARGRSAAGRRGKLVEVPDRLPAPGESTSLGTYKLDDRLLTFVRAKAEMEGRTVTDVVAEALESYAAAPPGARSFWSVRR